MEIIKKAILLSGGVDSISLTYNLRPDIAYTVDYGQRAAEREIFVSKFVCERLSIEHQVIIADCKSLGSGTLVDKENIQNSSSEEWWPFRNQLLITLASMVAIKDNISEIYLASVKSDSFHLDGTRKFYTLINDLVSFQEGSIKIICPTLDFYSHELVTRFKVPIELISIAHSCHVSNIACGQCSGCIKQIKVRNELGLNC